MPDACGRTFDEAFLSGYLDQALVQGDEQRVRVHLEDCVSCRALLEELASVRDATMSSTFDIPRDDEWPAQWRESAVAWPRLATDDGLDRGDDRLWAVGNVARR